MHTQKIYKFWKIYPFHTLNIFQKYSYSKLNMFSNLFISIEIRLFCQNNIIVNVFKHLAITIFSIGIPIAQKLSENKLFKQVLSKLLKKIKETKELALGFWWGPPLHTPSPLDFISS